MVFRIPNEDDLKYLARHMRKIDLDELEVTSDMTPLEAVEYSVKHSDPDFLMAAFEDGKLLCIWGCVRCGLLSDCGVPWLLCTQDISPYMKELIQSTRHVVRMMSKRYRTLTNVIDVRNKMTIRWLKMVGFTFKTEPEYREGFPLLRFEVINEKRIAY